MIFTQDVSNRLTTVAQRAGASSVDDVFEALGNRVNRPPIVVRSVLSDGRSSPLRSEIMTALEDPQLSTETRTIVRRRSGGSSGIVSALSRLLNMLPGASTNRALAMQSVREQIWNQVDALDMVTNDWNFLVDIYEEDGSLFALISRGPHLYRGDITIDGPQATLGEPVMVMEGFTPIEQSNTRIYRDESNGRYRWFSVSATACLNRSEEIDSQALFQSIQRNFESGDYPEAYRTIYHQGTSLQTGVVDIVIADGPVLMTGGYYLDSGLAELEMAAFQSRDDGYYGESIGYMNLAEPTYVNVGGEQIPVFTEGYLVEVSTVPQERAANLFTMPTVINRGQGDDSMYEMTPQAEALIRQMAVDSGMGEEQLAAVLGGINQTYRNISDGVASGSLVVRDDGQQVDQQAEVNNVIVDDGVALAVARQIATDETAVTPIVDALLVALQDEVNRAVEAALEEPARQIEQLTQRLQGVQASQTRQGTRLQLLDSEQESRNLALQRELSPTPVNHRLSLARYRNDDNGEQSEEVVPTMAETAASTRQSLNKGRRTAQGEVQ